MAKRKYTVNDINAEVNKFLSNSHKIEGDHQSALELVLSQYVDVVSKLPRKSQVEQLRGLYNHLAELKTQ